jgi:hypothetical protein
MADEMTVVGSRVTKIVVGGLNSVFRKVVLLMMVVGTVMFSVDDWVVRKVVKNVVGLGHCLHNCDCVVVNDMTTCGFTK